MSDYLLDCKRYYKDFTDITWRDSDLRKWLNDEFYNTAFDDSEKRFLKPTLCSENGEGTPDTNDKVFLLSVNELRSLSDTLGKDLRRAVGTEFAKVKKADGCRLYTYNLKDERNYKIENGQKFGYSWWWLRTQLGNSSRAAFVGTLASIRSYGRVNLPYYSVRSLWTKKTFFIVGFVGNSILEPLEPVNYPVPIVPVFQRPPVSVL